MCKLRGCWLALAAILLSNSGAGAQTEAELDARLFRNVMERLLASETLRKDYPAKYHFPPKYYVKAGSLKELNAYASAHQLHGAAVDPDSKKIRPVALITQGYLRKVVQGNGGMLAAIMGHELAHLTKDHVGNIKGDTSLLFWAFRRDQEIEADLEGMRYAVAAGYPYKAGIQSAIKEMKIAGNFTSFEGLQGSHPTWEERLRLLDNKQSELWKAMGAFQNGAHFLQCEQYRAAEQCYRAVTREFPTCAEAWANLGYAILMQYCDELEPEDIRRFGIGQIVAGAFYTRPQTLEPPTRGVNEKLWKAAVQALEKAAELNDKLVLPPTNLGLAHLVHPEGKDANRAAKYFNRALSMVKADRGLDDLAAVALVINTGVADLARGDRKASLGMFQLALDITRKMKLTQHVFTMEDALLYNRALLAASGYEKEKRDAFVLTENYLKLSALDSAWWPLAFELYTRLGKDLGLDAKPRSDFTNRTAKGRIRLVASVQFGPDLTISLSEPTKDVVGRLGGERAVALPLYPNSKLVRLREVQPGVDLLADDKVLAIFLSGAKAPSIILQGKGLSSKAGQIDVGMSERELADALKDQPAEISPRSIDNPDVTYRFYPGLGIAVRVDGGRVVELVVVQIPRKAGPLK